MSELKTVVILNDEIYHVGEWDYNFIDSLDENDERTEIALTPLPEGAIVEQREMQYIEGIGWVEKGSHSSINELEKLKADLMYLAIMTGVDL